MGGQFDSADEARLFQACEKILLDIPEQGNIMSCALDIKRLVPMLRKTGFSRDATPAAIRKVSMSSLLRWQCDFWRRCSENNFLACTLVGLHLYLEP
jgi:hypothetical protein